jgi:hypothetical protein
MLLLILSKLYLAFILVFVKVTASITIHNFEVEPIFISANTNTLLDVFLVHRLLFVFFKISDVVPNFFRLILRIKFIY